MLDHAIFIINRYVCGVKPPKSYTSQTTTKNFFSTLFPIFPQQYSSYFAYFASYYCLSLHSIEIRDRIKIKMCLFIYK